MGVFRRSSKKMGGHGADFHSGKEQGPNRRRQAATARPGQAFATEYRVRAGLLLAVSDISRPDNTVRKPLERHPGPALAWPHEPRSRRLLQRHPRATPATTDASSPRSRPRASTAVRFVRRARPCRAMSFYATAAAAQGGRLPSCLRCRPEIAPPPASAPLPASVARALQRSSWVRWTRAIWTRWPPDRRRRAPAAAAVPRAPGRSPVAVAQTRRVLLAATDPRDAPAHGRDRRRLRQHPPLQRALPAAAPTARPAPCAVPRSRTYRPDPRARSGCCCAIAHPTIGTRCWTLRLRAIAGIEQVGTLLHAQHQPDGAQGTAVEPGRATRCWPPLAAIPARDHRRLRRQFDLTAIRPPSRRSVA